MTSSHVLTLSRSRRPYLPSIVWRFVTYGVIVCLLGTDPRFDFFTLHAQCTTPWNPSTPTTRVTQFSYDFDGRVTQMNAPEGVINYTYDLPTGRLTGTCTANSQIAYAYDQLGRLSTVRVLERNGIVLTNAEVTTYTYDNVGDRSRVTLPNGVVTTYLYDSLNRLTNLTHQAGSTNLATYSYKLDRTGRRTNAVEVLLQEGGAGYLTNTLTWQYDGMYRLTNELSACSLAAGQYSTAYQYDKAGNRLNRIEVVGGTNYTTASGFDRNDELLVETSIQNGFTNGATGYAYDLNGSLTGKTNGSGTISYTYNLANKLSSVAASGITIAFCYNDQGIRVSSATSSSTNTYLVDANNHTGYQQVLEQFSQSGGLPSLTKSYVIGDDVLAQCSASTNAPSYFLADGHGSNRQLVNTVSGLASHYSYDAYGQTQTNTSSAVGSNTKLYCGEQWDSTLNMYNLRARYYDPANGRFNQRDIFAGLNSDPQTLHKYAYADEAPVNLRDPSGQQSTTEVLVVVALVYIVALGYNLYAKQQDLKTAAVCAIFPAVVAAFTLFFAPEIAAIIAAAQTTTVGLWGLALSGTILIPLIVQQVNEMVYYVVHGTQDQKLAAIAGILSLMLVTAVAVRLSSIPNAAPGVGPGSGTGARLVIGAGRAVGFPGSEELLPGDVTLNTAS